MAIYCPCDKFTFQDNSDSFQTWDGLRGPAGPAGPQGPPGEPGTGLFISGTVATVEDLPETAPQSTMYNVGTAAPYTIYMYDETDGWTDLGQLEGPAGPAGPQGPAGADGAPGAPGAAATIAVGTVSGLPAGSTPTVTNSGSSSAAVFDFGIPAGASGATGPQGPQGEPGKGLTISGTVATVSQLPATAEQGTVYNVGASAPYELYMYETGSGWISLGYLEGPEGPQGPAGSDGTTFTPAVSAAGVISWTNDGGKTNPQPVNIKGPQGDPGAAGGDGTTFTPSVSAAGVISWTNDGGKTNPDPVNIKGPQGETGSAGTPGAAATIAVGTVSGLPAGSTPTVTNSGSSSAAVFSFGIPAGADGATGPTGPAGPQGPAGADGAQIYTAALTIPYASWTGSGPYTQTVTITGATITAATKVDLQADATALAQLINDGVTALFIVNNAGTLTATAIGAATTADLTVQVCYYETV